MSELKATTAQEIVRNEKDCDYMDELFGGVKMPPTQVYIKSEADKVIAELNIFGKEFIAVRKLGPCKMNPDRNKWIISAYVNGGNLYAVINYCPMCGRKLAEEK